MRNGESVGNESTLLVTNIDASSGGSYTCSVSNAAGNDSASTTLYVAPYIVTPLEEQTLTQNGSNVDILCNVVGFPNPTVKWVDRTNKEVSNSTLLQFSPIMFGDEGLYCCEATAETAGTYFNDTYATILSGIPVANRSLEAKALCYRLRVSIHYLYHIYHKFLLHNYVYILRLHISFPLFLLKVICIESLSLL